MKVTITARHLKLGLRQNPRCCPVALALVEATGGAVSVGTSGYSIELGRYYMEAEGTKFILDFDAGRNPKPCTLELGTRRCV